MKKFRIISMFLAVAMLITLFAGCGAAGTGTDTSTAAVSTGTAAAASTAAPAPAPAKEKVTLNFWHSYPDNQTDVGNQEMNRMVKEWNDQYGSEIEVVALPNQGADKQLAAISAGEGPDIAQAQWVLAPAWGSQGAMEPLNKYMDADPTFDVSDFVKGALEQGQFRGKQYIIPYYMMTMLIFYNKDLLKEAGFDNGPTTIEELVNMGEKLTKYDAKGNITQLGFSPIYPWRDDVAWPVAFGANWVDDKGHATFDSPEMHEAYQWMADYNKIVSIPKVKKFMAGFGEAANGPFIKNQIAIQFNGDWAFDDIKQFRPDMNYGVTFCPPPASRKDTLSGTGMIGTNGWFMNSQSKHKDEAWKFLSFISGKDQYAKAAMLDIPQSRPRISALAALQQNPKATDMQKTVAGMYAANKMRGFSTVTYINQYLGEVYTEMTAACEDGTKTVDDACKAVQAFVKPYADTEAIGNALQK